MSQNKVNPKHYNKYKYQPIDLIIDLFGENAIIFLVGQVIKYVSRHEDKDGIVDLEKARFFLDMIKTEPEVDMTKVYEFTPQIGLHEGFIINQMFIDLEKARIGLNKLIAHYPKPEVGEHGYHITPIKKGELGKLSKIQEEVDELVDAEQQGSRIMQLVECADIYGALEAYVDGFGLTMEDLKSFSNITKRAFKNGKRN